MAVFDERLAPARQGSGQSGIVQIAAAAASVALLAGVGFWGYQLVMRDVSGIPVVRAVEGDMRVAPENPGGGVAAHTGLAVNEVAARGGAAPLEDVLLLAPTGSDLAPEDLTAPLPKGEETTADPVALDNLINMIVADVVAEVPELAEVDTVSATLPGVARSIRPASRPTQLGTPVAEREVAVSDGGFPIGTHLVQLGSFRSPSLAAEEWTRLVNRFGPLLAEQERVIEVSNQTSGTWYRLRAAGFEERADARRLCAALQAEQVICVPLVVSE